MLVFVFFYGYGDPRDLQVLTHFSLHDALPILRLDDLPCERQSQPEPAIRGSAAIGGGAIEGMADRLAAHAGAVVRNDDPRRMIVAVGVQQHAPALGRARDRMAQHMLDPLLEPPPIALHLAPRPIQPARAVHRAPPGTRGKRTE